MSQLRDIKDRINSVKKTKKMTQAMKMVSASKFKRFSNLAVSSRFIIHELDFNINQISSESNGIIKVPIMKPVDSKKDLILIISSDRGLCGGFNSNILKYATNFMAKSKHETDLILFGKKSYSHFKSKDTTIFKYFENFLDDISIESISRLSKECTELYLSQRYSRVFLLYNEFKTAVTSNLIAKQLFPILWSEKDDKDVDSNIIIEPGIDEVLSDLGELFVKHSLYNAFLESSAAEQGARMAAMDAATSNAGDMITELTLLYNRKRQAQITTELSEIVAGAEALVN